jgi:butyrate kinase
MPPAPIRILALNPGSTTTRAAVYDGDHCAWHVELEHDRAELDALGHVSNQLDHRFEAVRRKLAAAGLLEPGSAPAAVAGRGGLLAPLPGGCYAVNERMLDDLARARHGEHPCNLGAPLARRFADLWNVPAVIADPVVTDELAPEARLTGFPDVMRRTIFHALSQRGAARTAAERAGTRYEDGRFIVAHLGGGISVGAHLRGRVVEVNNALDGEGPFSPERSGRLPLLPLLGMIESGEATPGELRARILRGAGLLAHLGTNDLRWAEAMANAGDERARLVLEGMAYGIAREIGSLGPVLLRADEEGGKHDTPRVTAIVLAGGMARSDRLCAAIEARVSYLAPVERVTGLEEMLTLARGAQRVLAGEAELKTYAG